MVFSTIEFLFQFLPVFLVCYYLTPSKYRNVTLIAGSFVFYAIGSKWYLLLLIFSALLNFVIGRLVSIYHMRGNRHAAKVCFWIGIVYNVGMLVVFKYTNFVIENLNLLLGVFSLEIPHADLVMPLGISFYTFQIVSYLADVYTQKHKPAQSLLELGVYMCMFPNLISGPITNFGEMQPQIRKRYVDIGYLEEGLRVFVMGLGAKTLLANPMGGLWNNLSVIGYDSVSTPYAWLGAVAYSFQIYFDFSGYSLMALGVGRMLGFELPINFNLPYTSGSVQEFWRRWHITLGRWFRNYIYIPLGGNRHGTLKTIRNLLAVWLLTGLWHGASWNYVLWGLVLFLFLVLEKFVYGRLLEKTHILKHIYLPFVIMMTWVIFAIPDIHQIGVYFSRLFPIFSDSDAYNNRDAMLALRDYWNILIPCFLFSTPLPMMFYRKYHKSAFCILLLLVIFVLSVRAMMQQTDNPFLYFQF